MSLAEIHDSSVSRPLSGKTDSGNKVGFFWIWLLTLACQAWGTKGTRLSSSQKCGSWLCVRIRCYKKSNAPFLLWQHWDPSSRFESRKRHGQPKNLPEIAQYLCSERSWEGPIPSTTALGPIPPFLQSHSMHSSRHWGNYWAVGWPMRNNLLFLTRFLSSRFVLEKHLLDAIMSANVRVPWEKLCWPLWQFRLLGVKSNLQIPVWGPPAEVINPRLNRRKCFN